MLYDAHNHLQDAWLHPHREQVLTDLKKLPIARMVVNGTCQGDWTEVTELASAHAFVLPSYGLHPWNVGNASDGWRRELDQTMTARLAEGQPVAVGEIGLDRWMLERARADDPRLAGLRRASLSEQIEAFSWQLHFAAARNLAVTIHCLDAWGALTEILRNGPRPARGFLLHAYGGSADLARTYLELGAYFSFNGYFLGERQAAKRAVFAQLPADRVLVETDAPAMPPPENIRAYSLPGLADGNPVNHPGNIAAIYAGLATVRSTPVETLSVQVAENFRRLFGPAHSNA
jgi:TatD DNase family protein